MAATNIQTFAGQVEVTSNLTVDTNTLHVDSVAGRVGIGKTDPAFAMDVDGTVNATALYVGGSEFRGSPWTESGSNIYYTGGNVGIGTATAPQKTLEVAGPMRITDGGTNVSDLSVVGADGWSYDSSTPSPGTSAFGGRVDISNDGIYAVAGDVSLTGPTTYSPGAIQGTAYIYKKSGSTWTLQNQFLPNGAPLIYHRMGTDVKMSGDGSYALVGAIGNGGPDKGACYVFYNNGSSWTQQQRISSPGFYFGRSIGITPDGSTAIIGSIGGYSSATIWTRSGTTWSLQQTLSVPYGPSSAAGLGDCVSISSDGSWVCVGAYKEDRPGQPTNDNVGAAYIFGRSGSTWSSYTKLDPPAPYIYAGGWYGGGNAAISNDASYAVVSSDRGGTPTQGYYVYVRTGEFSWTFQQKISGDGTDVSINPTGDRLAIAGSARAQLYTRNGTTWSLEANLDSPAGYADNGVGASDDVDIVIANRATEANYIFTKPNTSLTVSTPIVADGTLLSFTGQHICFPEGPMGQGLVVSANKNKYVSLNGSLTTGTSAIKSSEALPVVSLSNVANDRSVFGVVDHFEQSGTTRSQKSGATVIRQDKESGDNRVIVNSLGEGAIWVANTNGNVVSGDFLTTSHLPGYAQRQEGHIFKSYTVAKSTMDCDFEPEDLPVQVILKDDDGNNVLDSYGRLQWVDSDRTEPEYRIRYLDVSGTPTDEANAVHKAAYVGCTYHCG